MQNLEDVKLKKLKDNNNTKIKITNINNDKNANINNDKNANVQGGNGYDGGYGGYNDGYNGINNGYNWYYGGYGAPNWYNPYYFGSYLPWMPPYQDEQQPIIINNIPDRQNMTPHMPLTHRMDLICLVIVVILIVLLFVKK